MAELIVQLAAAAGLRLSSTASSVGAVLELWTVVEGRLWARQQPTRQLRALLQTDEVLLAVEQPPQAPQGQEQEQAQQQHEFVQLVHRVPRRQPMQLVGIPALLRVPLAAAAAGLAAVVALPSTSAFHITPTSRPVASSWPATLMSCASVSTTMLHLTQSMMRSYSPPYSLRTF